jgi:hypothetical protein
MEYKKVGGEGEESKKLRNRHSVIIQAAELDVQFPSYRLIPPSGIMWNVALPDSAHTSKETSTPEQKAFLRLSQVAREHGIELWASMKQRTVLNSNPAQDIFVSFCKDRRELPYFIESAVAYFKLLSKILAVYSKSLQNAVSLI